MGELIPDQEPKFVEPVGMPDEGAQPADVLQHDGEDAESQELQSDPLEDREDLNEG